MRSEHKTRGAEWDAFTGWRHYLCYLRRAGVRKSIKQDSHRIDRRAKKQELKRPPKESL